MKFFIRKSLLIGSLIAILFIFAASQTCIAETKYVTELMEVTMRTGKGVGNKIVAMLQSGEAVKLLEPNEDWSLVENSQGKRGWVLTRFLTGAEPKGSMLEKLQRKHESLTEQARVLSEENESVKAENAVLKTELDANNKALEELTFNYETLKEESSDFMDLKKREEEARSKVRELSFKAEKLEKENSTLKNRQSIRWFVAGAGVLFVGFLIGMISKRKRRRSSLL